MLYPILHRRRDPFALMRSMVSDFDRNVHGAALRAVFPAVNLWQGEEAIVITAELPGVEPSDIDIMVKDNVLTLSGERKAPEVCEGARWRLNERDYGKFNRAMQLPFNASDDKVEAQFKNGVLMIVVGRPDEDKPRKIEIKAA